VSTTTIDTTASIQELQLNPAISRAVNTQSSADFGILMAMLNSDFALPKDAVDTSTNDSIANIKVAPEAKPIADDQAKINAAEISNQFHQGGLQSAKLQQALTPDALTYPTAEHQGLGEEVYHNLGYHHRKSLGQSIKVSTLEPLINALTTNLRESQLAHCA
jgi:hypothetical protein